MLSMEKTFEWYTVELCKQEIFHCVSTMSSLYIPDV